MGMKIGVIYPSLNYPYGGGEYLCLSVVKALQSMRFDVHLYTLDKINWKKLQRFSNVERYQEHPLVPAELPFTNRYFAFINSLISGVEGLTFRHIAKDMDLTIAFDLNAPATLNYVYTPLNLASKTWWYPLHEIFIKHFRLFYARKSKIMFLSTMIKKEFNKLGLWGEVLYPPVKFTEKTDLQEKENLIVTISRITPFKNLENLLLIAQKLQKYKFVIVGSLQNAQYYDFLKRRTPSNLKILINLPEKEKIELLRKAKFYVHLARYEPFGISILEAMWFGAIPIVHKSGGPWEDIVYYGNYGLGYNQLDEIIKLIDDIRNELIYDDLARLVIKRANDFSFNKFMQQLSKYILSVYEEK